MAKRHAARIVGSAVTAPPVPLVVGGVAWSRKTATIEYCGRTAKLGVNLVPIFDVLAAHFGTQVSLRTLLDIAYAGRPEPLSADTVISHRIRAIRTLLAQISAPIQVLSMWLSYCMVADRQMQVRIRGVATLDHGRGVLVGPQGAARLSPLQQRILTTLHNGDPAAFMPTPILACAAGSGGVPSLSAVTGAVSTLRESLRRVAPSLQISAHWGRGYRLTVRSS